MFNIKSFVILSTKKKTRIDHVSIINPHYKIPKAQGISFIKYVQFMIPKFVMYRPSAYFSPH